MGVLAAKAAMVIHHHKEVGRRAGVVHNGRIKLRWLFVLWISINLIRRGRLAPTVYNIKYVLA